MADPHIQALAGIAANFIEISGYVCGVPVLLGALITGFNGYPGYTKKLVALGVSSLFLGFLIPGVVNDLLHTHDIAAAILGWIVLLPLAAACIWAFFLPMRIALRETRDRATPIVVLNLLAIIPFSWHCALIWATAHNRQQRTQTSPQSKGAKAVHEADGDIAQYQPLFDHAKRLQTMLEEKCGKDTAARIDKALSVGPAGGAFIPDLEQTLNRLFLAGTFSDDIGDETRSLMAEISATRPEPAPDCE